MQQVLKLLRLLENLKSIVEKRHHFEELADDLCLG
jgi:hypothetical protein